jgi:hypothetical protein
MNEPATVTRDEQIVLLTKVERAGVCRVCGSPVTWTRTIAGALMPLEPELRVRALLSPSLQVRKGIRIAYAPGVPETVRVKDAKHEAKLVAKGFTVREELYQVWEMPASLTHWPNCKAAAANRTPKRERRQ